MKPYSSYEIKNIKDKWYSPFREIYTTSFPVFEQRSPKQQSDAFKDSHYHLSAWIDGEKLLSFVSYWDFEGYIYIEHLAVNPELRGQNIGSQMLDAFADEVKKTVILEIDPLIDEVSEKRLAFYEKLGYKINKYKHTHPAYNKDYKPHNLVVLSLYEELKDEEYQQFYNDLVHIVMKDY
ncbi:ribosomal protein S18 acetylase RimI-like enzyme [Dysgonomonas sp. PFB1-18]|uniref:GNAT family N-acetyltransferase n=1 Tax=unclassified Dysgonomonas TaxID=2630389 RepID=UPI002473D4AA|nr:MULTISPECIES: GNAT family N-acetyltransferase [unclassified Dysgonomonas]MDH6311041.1 ribosomal protein S18 acetylase RimI-like enzyme [Dysgonomonas sp. PF1-14]MDH6337890.1 ribosomal protein S18 acetylase RimI-like enzyme [Dysgonomonas sp. PF1-16]MDH6382589.1 ribosomal protein S18 acetylase RimI-like enzyme [Dysgonomonas sp. PFB1-18]MDH6398022.1 ribosomal protein S18 acetylase RimI-like enzyme [Dysgonomonas sp. PF1-23]